MASNWLLPFLATILLYVCINQSGTAMAAGIQPQIVQVDAAVVLEAPEINAEIEAKLAEIQVDADAEIAVEAPAVMAEIVAKAAEIEADVNAEIAVVEAQLESKPAELEINVDVGLDSKVVSANVETEAQLAQIDSPILLQSRTLSESTTTTTASKIQLEFTSISFILLQSNNLLTETEKTTLRAFLTSENIKIITPAFIRVTITMESIDITNKSTLEVYQLTLANLHDEIKSSTNIEISTTIKESLTANLVDIKLISTNHAEKILTLITTNQEDFNVKIHSNTLTLQNGITVACDNLVTKINSLSALAKLSLPSDALTQIKLIREAIVDLEKFGLAEHFLSAHIAGQTITAKNLLVKFGKFVPVVNTDIDGLLAVLNLLGTLTTGLKATLEDSTVKFDALVVTNV